MAPELPSAPKETVKCADCDGTGRDEGHRDIRIWRLPDAIVCDKHGDVGWGRHGLCGYCEGAGKLEVL